MANIDIDYIATTLCKMYKNMYGQFGHVLRMFVKVFLVSRFCQPTVVFSNTNDTSTMASFLSLDCQTLLLLLIYFVAEDRIQNNITGI